MTHPSDRTKEDLQKGLAALQTLRDEIRLKMHLAGMDAKDRWKELEPELEKVEAAAHDLSDTARTAMSDALHEMTAFLESIGLDPSTKRDATTSPKKS